MSVRIEFSYKLGLESVWIRDHLASGNFIRCRSMKAELANTESAVSCFFHSHWRTKFAASHRTVRIEVTGASFGIQRRTWFFIGEAVKGSLRLIVFVQDACCWITREAAS